MNGVFDAFTQAVAAAFTVGFITAVLALIVTIFLPEVPLRGMSRKPAGGAGGPGGPAPEPEIMAPGL